MRKVKSFCRSLTRALAILVMTAVTVTAVPALSAAPGGGLAAHAASGIYGLTATGRITDHAVNLRKSASGSSKILYTFSKGAKLTIYSETYKSKKSTARATRWYHVSAGGRSGYVNAAYVKITKYNKLKAETTDELNYRSGPGTSYKLYGCVDPDTKIQLMLTAYGPGSGIWYRARVKGRTAFVSGDYVRNTQPIRKPTSKQLKGKSDLAVSLLTKPKRGGRARYVDTFSEENCIEMFTVTGHEGISTPQGLAFTGKQYYVLYGNSAGQRIVTYSASGERLAATNFQFAIGHPNGITWDPDTGLCYIFKGHQKRIYTWDPVTNEFGKSSTPYIASGGAYDSSSGLIYGSSKPRMCIFSGDGNFSTLGIYSRCDHGIAHSAQDCGAGRGIVLHGVSGSDFRNVNFLDVYRPEDGVYLGSVKIALGEIESIVVGRDGYVYLLINHRGETDAVWKTPLNVKELKF